MRTFLVLFTAACGLVMGCGNRLSPAETCTTLLNQADMCGTYRPGAFRGTDLASDIANCTNSVRLFNEECQGLASDLARCTTRGCTTAELEPCNAMLPTFNARCAP